MHVSMATNIQLNGTIEMKVNFSCNENSRKQFLASNNVINFRSNKPNLTFSNLKMATNFKMTAII